MTQNDALSLLKMGHNVYLTGAAGSGKTYVLNQYIQYLKENNITVGITASTGIAATHINGMTIHSWSGLGIKDALTEKDIATIKDKIHLRLRFMSTKVLIIDEISMLHGYRLDMVDRVCRAFKYKDIPFGGFQVVICGDFFQLPPITRGSEDGSFAYQSQVWNQMNLKVCYLSEQHRQSEDGILTILNDIRRAGASEDTLELLRSRYRKEVEGMHTPTKLFTHNVDVDSINSEQLEKIDGNTKEFIMQSHGNRDLVEILKKSCLAPQRLALKIGAQVMFVKNNYDQGYVNGTLGTIIDFQGEPLSPVVETKDGREILVSPERWVIEDEGVVKAEISQIPLRLAWAITIHKSQGMSLDAAEIDLSKSFVPGMGYVALSRVRTLAGMKVIGFNPMALRVNEDVLAIDQEFMKESFKNEADLNNMPENERKSLQKDFVQRNESAK